MDNRYLWTPLWPRKNQYVNDWILMRDDFCYFTSFFMILWNIMFESVWSYKRVVGASKACLIWNIGFSFTFWTIEFYWNRHNCNFENWPVAWCFQVAVLQISIQLHLNWVPQVSTYLNNNNKLVVWWTRSKKGYVVLILHLCHFPWNIVFLNFPPLR